MLAVMKPERARERATCYLASALELLHVHEKLPHAAEHRRSALKLQAKALLGGPLTKLLVDSGDKSVKRYTFAGDFPARTDDHVIPLDAIIEHVFANLDRFPRGRPDLLHRFIAPRIVMALIPTSVDRDLNVLGFRARMPSDSWTRSLAPQAVWERYSVLGVPSPGEVDSPFGPR